jgi:hypothetical protein
VSSSCKLATAQVSKDSHDGSNLWVANVQADVTTCTTMQALAGSGAPRFGTITTACFGEQTSSVPGEFNNEAVDPEDSQTPGCQDVLRHFQSLGGLVDLSTGIPNSVSTYLPAFNRLTKLFASEGGTETTTS